MRKADRTSRDAVRVRAVCQVVALAMIVLGTATPLRAQASLSRPQGVQMGPVNFYPSLAIDYSYNDNVFYVSQEDPDEIISSGLFMLAPKFLFSLPIGESEIRWAYAPLLRHYGSDAYSEAIGGDGSSARKQDNSHRFDLDATFHFGPVVRLIVFDHLMRGTQELREVDPGGETTFGTVPFLLNDAALELQCDLGGRSGFSIRPRLSTVQFDQDANAVFYNYDTSGLEARYNHRMTPDTTMYASFTQETTNQTRTGDSLYGDVTIDTDRAGVGLTRTVNRAVTAAAYVGYARLNFEGGAASNYSGLTANVGAGWLITDITRLDVTLRQEPYQSFYINNNYYVNRLVNARVTRQVGQSLLLMAGAGYEQNSYSDALDPAGFEGVLCLPSDPMNCPSRGVLREDRVIHFEAAVGFQMRPTLRWSVGYNHEARESNVVHWLTNPGVFYDPFDYRVGRISMHIDMGWM